MRPAVRGLGSLIAVGLLLVVVGGAIAWRLLGDNPRRSAESPRLRPALPDTAGVEASSAELFGDSRPVEGARVIRDTLWIQVVGSGVAMASRQSRVTTRSAGVVQRVFVREGEPVAIGDPLIQLDTAEATLNLLRARAALTRAQAHYEQGRLMDRTAGSSLSTEEQEDRDRVLRAEAGLTEAELTLAEREMELEFTRVRAPFAGRIADLRAVAGAFLTTGAEVLTLVQLAPIQVHVDVLEAEIGLIAVGRRARVRFNALGGETLEGRVESINPRIDPATRSGRVTVSLPNPRGRILPGNYVSVSLDAEPLPDRILIPRQAVTTRGENHREVVFVLEQGDAEGRGLAGWRYVSLGRRNDRFVELIPGDETVMLAPGEIVLVGGHHYLAHHTAVHLVDNVYQAGGIPGR